MSQVLPQEQLSAGALAMVVHVLFLAAMVFGLSWTTLPEVPVYADLWNALPTPPPPPPPPSPSPSPSPEIAPEPRPTVAVEPPPQANTAEADIALKKEAEAKRKKAAQERLETEKKRKLEAELDRLEQERVLQEERLLNQRRAEERKAAEARRLAQERLRKEMERLMAEQTAEQMEAENEQLARVANAARAKVIDDYRSRIQAKIRGLLVIPPGVKGNPEVVYRVQLLPNGEVLRVTLVKASGQPPYDQQVEHAILKASPLPLPPDKADAAAFRDGLELRFRPLDEDGNGRR